MVYLFEVKLLKTSIKFVQTSIKFSTGEMVSISQHQKLHQLSELCDWTVMIRHSRLLGCRGRGTEIFGPSCREYFRKPLDNVTRFCVKLRWTRLQKCQLVQHFIVTTGALGAQHHAEHIFQVWSA